MLTAFIIMCVALCGSQGQASPPTPLATIRAGGVGYAPPRMPGAQGRLMARRAAEVVAVRNLAVKLGVGPRGRLPSFRYVSTKDLPSGAVEVTVETTVPVGRVTTARATTRNGVRPRRQVGGRP